MKKDKILFIKQYSGGIKENVDSYQEAEAVRCQNGIEKLWKHVLLRGGGGIKYSAESLKM